MYLFKKKSRTIKLKVKLTKKEIALFIEDISNLVIDKSNEAYNKVNPGISQQNVFYLDWENIGDFSCHAKILCFYCKKQGNKEFNFNDFIKKNLKINNHERL